LHMHAAPKMLSNVSFADAGKQIYIILGRFGSMFASVDLTNLDGPNFLFSKVIKSLYATLLR